MAQKIRHRGPDWSGIYVGGSAILAHERLSIVDPESGGQPLYSPDHKQVLAGKLRAGHARPLQSGYYKVEGIKNPTTGGGGKIFMRRDYLPPSLLPPAGFATAFVT